MKLLGAVGVGREVCGQRRVIGEVQSLAWEKEQMSWKIRLHFCHHMRSLVKSLLLTDACWDEFALWECGKCARGGRRLEKGN